MKRRRVLAGLAAATSLSGCLGSVTSSSPAGSGSPPPGDLAEWTRSTDCDGMHDSVVTVQWTTESVRDAYAPIRFSELPADEQSLLRPVVEEGGVGTCDPSEAFVRFVRRVAERMQEQSADDHARDVVYLEYEGWYYGLYVERNDEVYSG